MSGEKKIGRPIIGKAKDIRLTIRVDEDTLKKLNAICKQEGVSQSECVRRLINRK